MLHKTVDDVQSRSFNSLDDHVMSVTKSFLKLTEVNELVGLAI